MLLQLGQAVQRRGADHDQAVGYDTVIVCPVSVCDESIRNPCQQYLFALFAESKNGTDSIHFIEFEAA